MKNEKPENPIIEIFGMRVELVNNAAHGQNWCTMCALEPFCEKTTIESTLYPCTNTKGRTDGRFFRRVWDGE